VSTAAVPANGPLRELSADDVRRAFDAKVVGPLLLAGHLADRLDPAGSLTFFSGVAAWRPAAGRVVMATTNGALAFLVQALAVELAPVRVNAVGAGDRRLRRVGPAWGEGRTAVPRRGGREQPHPARWARPTTSCTPSATC
jgi:NAD(P)-dependent dehydrogenase (short-subunit alcohol dehydrogenase family)